MKRTPKTSVRQDSCREELRALLNPRHELCQLAEVIDWEAGDSIVSDWFVAGVGRVSKRSRLIVGLFLLKQLYNVGDDDLPARWVENPYWQYFCGEVYFQHKYPIHPTSMSKWRGKMGEGDAEALLALTVKSGLASGTIKGTDLNRVNVDTTVQEKAITYPTDAKLYAKGIATLGALAKAQSLPIKQSYKYVSRQLLFKANNYGRAQQFKRAKKMTRKLHTNLGRLYRDIQRQLAQHPEKRTVFTELLPRIEHLLTQQRHDKHKLYSLHAPEVECIAKGKVNKRYEFGVKASLVSTQTQHFLVGAQALHGNPYDGHTLEGALNQMQALTGRRAKRAFVDNGYKGHTEKQASVHVARKKSTYATRYLKQLMRGRNAIEAVISHNKRDGQLGRNYLGGEHGDKLNVLLSAVGYNLRIILRTLKIVWCQILSPHLAHLKQIRTLHKLRKYSLAF